MSPPNRRPPSEPIVAPVFEVEVQLTELHQVLIQVIPTTDRYRVKAVGVAHDAATVLQSEDHAEPAEAISAALLLLVAIEDCTAVLPLELFSSAPSSPTRHKTTGNPGELAACILHCDHVAWGFPSYYDCLLGCVVGAESGNCAACELVEYPVACQDACLFGAYCWDRFGECAAAADEFRRHCRRAKLLGYTLEAALTGLTGFAYPICVVIATWLLDEEPVPTITQQVDCDVIRAGLVALCAAERNACIFGESN